MKTRLAWMAVQAFIVGFTLYADYQMQFEGRPSTPGIALVFGIILAMAVTAYSTAIWDWLRTRLFGRRGLPLKEETSGDLPDVATHRRKLLHPPNPFRSGHE